MVMQGNILHFIEKHYYERDPEPAKLVEAISTNLKSAWNYLDQNYGDSRVVSDVVTGDTERFKYNQAKIIDSAIYSTAQKQANNRTRFKRIDH